MNILLYFVSVVVVAGNVFVVAVLCKKKNLKKNVVISFSLYAHCVENSKLT